ncbi:hypothetical protein TWF481_005084 [Arthrobotrys musiformis]|uniref:Uncharacterized protein n=1 Tax=Arthrobotrys musiformis TaxID=47236 RepID=A0AAV9WCT2_9PEZI
MNSTNLLGFTIKRAAAIRDGRRIDDSDDDDGSSISSLQDSIFSSASDPGTDVTVDIRTITFRVKYPRIFFVIPSRVFQCKKDFPVPFHDRHVAKFAEGLTGPFFNDILRSRGWIALTYHCPLNNMWRHQGVLHPCTGYSSYHEEPGRLFEYVSSWSPLYIDIHLETRRPMISELIKLPELPWIAKISGFPWEDYFKVVEKELVSMSREAEGIASILSSSVCFTFGPSVLQVLDAKMGAWYSFICVGFGETLMQGIFFGLLVMASTGNKSGLRVFTLILFLDTVFWFAECAGVLGSWEAAGRRGVHVRWA